MCYDEMCSGAYIWPNFGRRQIIERFHFRTEKYIKLVSLDSKTKAENNRTQYVYVYITRKSLVNNPGVFVLFMSRPLFPGE